MKPLLTLLVAIALVFASLGCGGGANAPTDANGPALSHSNPHPQRQAAKRRAVRRHQARVRAHRAAIRQAHRAAARQRQAEEAQARQREQAEAETRQAEEEANECDPNYAGACLNPYSSDYDCAGGSGNGPDYTGEVAVIGEDHYGLDADGDGVGCEPY